MKLSGLTIILVMPLTLLVIYLIDEFGLLGLLLDVVILCGVAWLVLK